MLREGPAEQGVLDGPRRVGGLQSRGWTGRSRSRGLTAALREAREASRADRSPLPPCRHTSLTVTLLKFCTLTASLGAA